LLATKGMPYPQAVAAFCVVAEAFGPVAVALGFAPRFAASVLIGSLVITTATFHRFGSSPVQPAGRSRPCSSAGSR